MVFKWVLNVEKIKDITAEQAAQELIRIENKHGIIMPKLIVDESRSESAPLYKWFEWDDTKAAEQYRETQASHLIRSIIRTDIQQDECLLVRAFIHIQDDYMSIENVLTVTEWRNEMLDNAKKELKAFTIKYQNLCELKNIITEIKNII